jgi:hypothetical protein
MILKQSSKNLTVGGNESYKNELRKTRNVLTWIERSFTCSTDGAFLWRNNVAGFFFWKIFRTISSILAFSLSHTYHHIHIFCNDTENSKWMLIRGNFHHTLLIHSFLCSLSSGFCFCFWLLRSVKPYLDLTTSKEKVLLFFFSNFFFTSVSYAVDGNSWMLKLHFI